MDDRITEIREALAWDTEYVEAVRKGDPSLTFQPFEVIVAAAAAYADLLDSDALIIRQDENGDWPEAVVTRIAFSLASFQLRRGIVPGDKQGAISLLDALALSQGVEP